MRSCFAIFFSALALVVSSASAAPAASEKTMQVAVSIIPQKYFVEKIGGAMVEVEVMVPPGAAPEQYEPKPKQMAALGRARLYFACGVPFETVWLPKIASANSRMLVVHTDKDIRKRTMEAHTHHGPGKTMGEDHHHDGEMKDPHIWLSPPLVMLQARAIFDALWMADPQNRKLYETNYREFITELAELDSSILQTLEPNGEPRPFMVFHPAWGYFAEAYGLEQIPVEVEGKEPRPRDLDAFIKLARKLGIKTIFVQPEFSPKSARTIADAVGAVVVQADVLAPDWENNLRQVAGRIAEALKRR